MAKYGLSMHENDARETPEQVSAYIKELFPRIPQDDLDKIVQHAWEEGSKRVGTNETMNLANRVQLAVTARIRHAYTDYDRLLKAFEWKEARAEVEPECVKKLKEWRGEDGTDDEEKGFEEAMIQCKAMDPTRAMTMMLLLAMLITTATRVLKSSSTTFLTMTLLRRAHFATADPVLISANANGHDRKIYGKALGE